MFKSFHHFTHALSQILLPVALCIVVGMIWYYFNFVHEIPEDNSNARNIRQSSTTADSVLFPSTTHALPVILPDTIAIFNRTNLYLKTILSSDWITGSELKASSKLMQSIATLGAYNPEFVRQQKELAEAIEAGAAESLTEFQIDSTLVADNLTLRNEKILPYYIVSIAEISKQIEKLNQLLKDGLLAHQALLSVAHDEIEWEQQVVKIEEIQHINAQQITEALLMVRALYGQDNDYSRNASPQMVQFTLNEVERMTAETDSMLLRLHAQMTKNLPAFQKIEFQFNTARGGSSSIRQWIALSQVFEQTALVIEGNYRAFCTEAPADIRNENLPQIQALSEISQKLSRATQKLNGYVASPQMKAMLTRQSPLKDILISAQKSENNQKLFMAQKLYLLQSLKDYEQGIRSLPKMPSGVHFATPSARPATLQLSFFDRNTSNPVTEVKITVEQFPNLIPIPQDPSHYRVAFEKQGNYTLTIRAKDYFPRQTIVKIDPNMKKSYQLSLQLEACTVENINQYAFLPAQTQIEQRIQLERDHVKQLTAQYRHHTTAIREFQKILGLRIHLIKHGLEPGEFIIPQVVKDILIQPLTEGTPHV